MTLHDMLNWLGVFTDVNFWSTPLGLFASCSMFLCCCINIWHPGIDDNWFDRIYYCCAAVLMLCAFAAGIHPGQNPQNLVQTFWILLWLRFAGSVLIRHREWKRTGKCQKTKCG